MVTYIDPVEVNMCLHASSVCEEVSGHYDVKNVLADDDSCWQSDEGNLHRIDINVDDYIYVNGFEIQFHADFAARQLSVTAFCRNNKTVLMKFSPEETFDIQCFLFENQLPTKQIAFKFANSNDMRGRVVVFRLSLTTELDNEGFEFKKGLTVEEVERIAEENMRKQELYEEMTAKMTQKMEEMVATSLKNSKEAGPSGSAKYDLTCSPYFMAPRTYEDPFEYMANGDYVYRVGPIDGNAFQEIAALQENADALENDDSQESSGSQDSTGSQESSGSQESDDCLQESESSQAAAKKE